MVAIPFHSGRRPFEQLAFQFSHHILHRDGHVEHRNQYIDLRVGAFPNFDFVRALRKSLAGQTGTIFRYAAHENTVLRQIRNQLLDSSESDANVLVDFIDSITTSDEHEGSWTMVDLKKLVADFYYHPENGRIKFDKERGACNTFDLKILQNKYAVAIYGTASMPSLNFENWVWIEKDENGNVRDPYKLLPPIFSPKIDELLDREDLVLGDATIKDGGMAMTAWSRAQFTEMSNAEREAIRQALLKYCELDTLAMVWILEELCMF